MLIGKLRLKFLKFVMWSLQPYCKQLIIAVHIENYFKTALLQTISHLNISFNFNINYIC